MLEPKGPPPVPAGINPSNYNPLPITSMPQQGQKMYVGALGPEAPLKQGEITEEMGATGTIIVAGIISQADYANELTGTQRIDIYDQMRKGDATVRAAIQAVMLPIQAADWYIEGDNKKIKEFVEKAMFSEMEYSFDDWLRHALLYLIYGSQVFEKVYKIGDDGMIYWKQWAPRLSKTIFRWTLMDGTTPGITQILPVGGLREIPEWKLLKLVNEQEGLNFEGISILRAAYKHWYMKDGYYKIDAIATERQGLGLPRLYTPPNASPKDRALASEMMRNLRVNESAYVDLPQGFDLEFIDAKATSIKNPKDMILHHDREIVKSVLAQFLELGGNGTGSFALSANQSELFLLSLQAVAKYVKQKVSEEIKTLVDLNFNVTKDGDYPTLEYSRIGQVDFKALSDALYKLSAAGLIMPDADLENHLREILNLPEALEGGSETENVNPDDLSQYTPDQITMLQTIAKSNSIEVKDLVRSISQAKTLGGAGQAGTPPAGPALPPMLKKAKERSETVRMMKEVLKLKHEVETEIHAIK